MGTKVQVDFKTAVKQMRLWQRTYFQTRHPEALKESKRWEKEVDRLLDEDEQPKLFEQ